MSRHITVVPETRLATEVHAPSSGEWLVRASPGGMNDSVLPYWGSAESVRAVADASRCRIGSRWIGWTYD
jgi:hypothetical protein